RLACDISARKKCRRRIPQRFGTVNPGRLGRISCLRKDMVPKKPGFVYGLLTAEALGHCGLGEQTRPQKHRKGAGQVYFEKDVREGPKGLGEGREGRCRKLAGGKRQRGTVWGGEKRAGVGGGRTGGSEGEPGPGSSCPAAGKRAVYPGMQRC